MEFIQSDSCEFITSDLDSTSEAKKILNNFQLIKRFCEDLNKPEWFTKNGCQFFDAKRFSYGGYKFLWKKTQDILNTDGSKAISEIKNNTKAHEYFRTLMLAAYFCNCVVVTTVITDDEEAAFDIFDRLNTTGEPLTALETLKPHVINTIKSANTANSLSRCELAFHSIDRIMANNFPEAKQKQDETRNLIITFAYYLEGRRIPQNLNSQRNVLRELFNNSKSIKDGPAKFMEALAYVSEYRSNYWTPSKIGTINSYHFDQNEAEQVKLLSSFICATKTSLTLPILARYWICGKEKNNFTDYLEVLKAITAFLTLRRAATGGTEGIDVCFRDIMQDDISPNKYGLCTGSKFDKQILNVSELKTGLKSKLESSKVKFKNKSEWIEKVVDNPIYTYSKPLVRFMLFCASDNTKTDTNNPGLLTREKISPSDDRCFLDFKFWNGEDYKTVEHVAPNSDNTSGWDPNIYTNNLIRNTLGNLVLLPAKENSVAGQDSWSKKKLFYSALTEKNEESQETLLNHAKSRGIPFSKKTESLILSGKRLSMLDGIGEVKDWDREFIEHRTRRLASLSWDKLRPWLD